LNCSLPITDAKLLRVMTHMTPGRSLRVRETQPRSFSARSAETGRAERRVQRDAEELAARSGHSHLSTLTRSQPRLCITWKTLAYDIGNEGVDDRSIDRSIHRRFYRFSLIIRYCNWSTGRAKNTVALSTNHSRWRSIDRSIVNTFILFVILLVGLALRQPGRMHKREAVEVHRAGAEASGSAAGFLLPSARCGVKWRKPSAFRMRLISITSCCVLKGLLATLKAAKRS